jgi:hypothetical protein
MNQKTSDEIRAKAALLDALHTELDHAVQEIEKCLEDCHLGVSVYHETNGGVLAYCQCSGRFRIAVKETGEGAFIPWSDCAREKQIGIIHSLPELLAKIPDEVNRMFSVAKNSVQRLRERGLLA